MPTTDLLPFPLHFRMRTGIITKLVGAAIRVAVFGPALIGLGKALDSFSHPNLWFTPMSRFWHLPLFNGLFALLCVLPYFDSLFKKAVKPVFLSVILLTCGFKFRYEFLPFHYAAPELASHPEYLVEFENTKKEPHGSGFSSQREEGGKMLWIVTTGNWHAQDVLFLGSFGFVPLVLFLLRNYEVRRGITWRNFTLPSQLAPQSGEHSAPQSPLR